MTQNPTPHEFQSTSPSDIRLSTWEYNDFIDAFNDDRLSARALFKFKELYRLNSIQQLVAPFVAFPIAWFANRWVVGFVNRGLGQSRFNLLGMALFYPLTLYWVYTRPLPRKLYTDLIADNGDDGEYIRNSLILHKPGLWQKISPQLEALGIETRENIRSKTGIQFPAAFVSAKSLL